MQSRILAIKNILPSDPYLITRTQLKRYTKDICSICGISFIRKLGQNFLVNPKTLQFLLLNATLKPNDTVLEIGGGIGTLSLYMAPLVKKLIIIEKDRRLINVLSMIFSDFDNVLILPGDACKIEWPSFNKMISNLPYQISSPITLRMACTRFNKAVITFQLEFAQRLIASAGDSEYSRLSVQSNLFFEIDLLNKLEPADFFPAPKVKSAIVKFTPRKNPPSVDLGLFRRFLAILFMRKNKKVTNNLIPYFKRIDKETSQLVEKILYLLKINDKRSLQLTPHEILQLFDTINVSFRSHEFSLTNMLLR